MVLEKTLESCLDGKTIKSVSRKGNQSWIFIRRTEDEAEAWKIWPLDAKSQLFRKDPDAGKHWRWKEKGTTEDEIVGLDYQLNGHEFEQTQGDGQSQGSLASCSPQGHKESDVTEGLSKDKTAGDADPISALELRSCMLHRMAKNLIILLIIRSSIHIQKYFSVDK